MAHDTSVGVVGVMKEMTDSKTGGGVACQHRRGGGGVQQPRDVGLIRQEVVLGKVNGPSVQEVQWWLCYKLKPKPFTPENQGILHIFIFFIYFLP